MWTCQDQTSKNELILWRYMSRRQFEKLLDPHAAYLDWGMENWSVNSNGNPQCGTLPTLGSLWFAFPDAYLDTDSYESIFPALACSDESYCRLIAKCLQINCKEVDDCREKYLAKGTETIRRLIRAMARLCGISCWHQCEIESPQMWSDYVPDGNGVAIKTTIGKLKVSLSTDSLINRKAKPDICTIQYIDLTRHVDFYHGCHSLLGLSCQCRKHENEMRFIAQSPFLANTDMKLCSDGDNERLAFYLNNFAGRLIENNHINNTPLGFSLPVDLSQLLMEIIVHPSACDLCVDSIARRVQEHGIEYDIVKRSKLLPEAVR